MDGKWMCDMYSMYTVYSTFCYISVLSEYIVSSLKFFQNYLARIKLLLGYLKL
jgi:hypothetical protein